MKKGFTLTEILVSLMVIAVVAAVSVPVFTHALSRQKASTSRPWYWNGNSGVFNTTSSSALVIGTSVVPEANATKLLINTSANEMYPILFYNNEEKVGHIKINDNGTFFSNYNLTDIEPYDNMVAVGNVAENNTNAVVIGNNSMAANDSVAIGYKARATGVNSVALGTLTKAEGSNAIAIGIGANAAGSNSIAIGTNATTPDNYSVAIGYNSYASNGSYVIGDNSSLNATNSILIGHNANDSTIPDNLFGGYVFTSDLASPLSVLSDGSVVSTPNVHTDTYSTTVLPSIDLSNKIILGTGNMRKVFRTNLYVRNTVYTQFVYANEIFFNSAWRYSDSRLKNVGSEYTSGVDKLNKLKVYNYTFKHSPSKQRVGVIAQNLVKIFPDAVSKDQKGYYTIRQEDIFYAMVNALKEFDKKIKTISESICNFNKLSVSLDKKIKKLTKQSDKNTSDIEKLKQEISSLERGKQR